MKSLIIYPNSSRGGVATVIRGRARNQPDRKFDAIFLKDRGGRNAFDDMSNVESRIVREDRLANYIKSIADVAVYDEVSVLSYPKAVDLLVDLEIPVNYEFHSSDMKVIRRELDSFETSKVSSLVVPSEYMKMKLNSLLPYVDQQKVVVRPNLIDPVIFNSNDIPLFSVENIAEHADIPLLAIGRFDKGKGFPYLLRALARLPKEYVGIFIVSLEDDPTRFASFLNEASALGVIDRIRVYKDLHQSEIASLMHQCKRSQGALVSASLMESFGYTVAEALAVGLRVFAFDLPVWDEFPQKTLFTRVAPGSVQELVAAILAQSSNMDVL